MAPPAARRPSVRFKCFGAQYVPNDDRRPSAIRRTMSRDAKDEYIVYCAASDPRRRPNKDLIRGFANKKILVHPAKCTENSWKIPPILGKFQAKKFQKCTKNANLYVKFLKFVFKCT